MIDYEKLMEVYMALERRVRELEFAIRDEVFASPFDEELTQPKSKYQIGQQIWMLDWENKPCELEIKDIDIGAVEKYLIRNEWRMGHALYPTKALLVEAQIEYWCSQKEYEPPFEEEHCQVSGAKLDKSTENDDPFKCCDGCHEPIGCCDCPEECQHESSGAPHYLADQKFWHVCDKCYEYFIRGCEHEPSDFYTTNAPDLYKCLKCGEFYR